MKNSLLLTTLLAGGVLLCPKMDAAVLMDFVESGAGVTGTITLDPADFTASGSWVQESSNSTTSTGPNFIGFGGSAGGFFLNPRDKSDLTSSTWAAFTGASSSAPNLGFTTFSYGDSATGEFISLSGSILNYSLGMFNLLTTQSGPVISTITWNNTTLAELGINSGIASLKSSSGPLSFDTSLFVTTSILPTSVPDGGATLGLFGLGLVGLGVYGRRSGRR
ncbi:MAG: hypothetical protein RI897_2723 [Verrucomicrobiota bacterium]